MFESCHMNIIQEQKKSDFQDAVLNLQRSITNSITALKNELKDEIINMKEVIIKRLQEENDRLRVRSS